MELLKAFASGGCVENELMVMAAENRYPEVLTLGIPIWPLLRRHPKEAVLAAARTARQHRLFRYRDLRRLTEMTDQAPAQRCLTEVDELIRPLAEYRLEVS